MPARMPLLLNRSLMPLLCVGWVVAVSTLNALGGTHLETLKDAQLTATPLSSRELDFFSSAKLQDPANIVILNSNQHAFKEKLDLIERSKSGDTIRLSYYIYSDDMTASVFTSALLRAAQRGVKIRMLLDLDQTYVRLDLFSALEAASGGRIQVRFYNRPTKNIVLTAGYLTTPCEMASSWVSTCTADEKNDQFDYELAGVVQNLSIEQRKKYDRLHEMNATNIQIGQSGYFLAAIYSGQFDRIWDVLKSGMGADKDFELLLSMWKHWARESFYPEERSTSMAFSANELQSKFVKDIHHFTDYSHQKLLMLSSDNSLELIIGGRNVEDSYHIADPQFISSFMFIDTDVMITVDKAVPELDKAFDRIWGMESMVAGTADIRAIMPNEAMANLAILEAQCQQRLLKQMAPKKEDWEDYRQSMVYLKKKHSSDFLKAFKTFKAESCDLQLEPQRFLDQKARESLALQNMAEGVAMYLKLLGDPLKPRQLSFLSTQISVAEDLNSEGKPEVFYLENIPFEKSQVVLDDQGQLLQSATLKPAERSYGVTYLSEQALHEAQVKAEDSDSRSRRQRLRYKKPSAVASGPAPEVLKPIHAALIRGMESTCINSQKAYEAAIESGQPAPARQKVIFQNAYFAPPANLLRAFSNMFNGVWNCSHVDVVIMTNSVQTTDLGIVNKIASYTFLPLLQMYNERKEASGRSAQLRYYEYKEKTQFFNRYLHSKVTVLGDSDIIIGSANADFRSYLMDSNNAVYIKNAPKLVKEYTELLINTIDDRVHRASIAPDGFYPAVTEVRIGEGPWYKRWADRLLRSPKINPASKVVYEFPNLKAALRFNGYKVARLKDVIESGAKGLGGSEIFSWESLTLEQKYPFLYNNSIKEMAPLTFDDIKRLKKSYEAGELIDGYIKPI